MDPTVSVIMAMYNSAAFLEEAVESLRRQTFRDWELIAVDDASRDATPEQIRALADRDPRIRVLRLPENVGAGAARDAAIRLARGVFIAVFDADDVCEPARLEKQLAFLRAHPEVVALGTQTVQVDLEGRPVGRKTFPTEHAALYRLMYTAIPIQLPTLMVNTARLPKGFDWFEGWRYSEDSLLFFKLASHGTLANLPEPLVRYRYHPGSTSYRNAKRYFYETWKSRRIARRQYGYRPTPRARLISGLQFVVVTCLPSRAIPWFYKAIRKVMLALTGQKAGG